MAKKKSTETELYEDDPPPEDAPAAEKMSDDASNLHVATAALTRHVQEWGFTGAVIHHEQLIEAAAKDVLDAVDAHIAGGGAEAEPPPPNPPAEEGEESSPS